MSLKYALTTCFNYNLPNGFHDIETEMLFDEFHEAYEGLTEHVGKLKMKIEDGCVVAAYRAVLGLVGGSPFLRNNFVDYEIFEANTVTVCRSLVFINNDFKYADELMTEVAVKDLNELRPLSEGGNSSSLIKVLAKKVPDGKYVLVSKELKELPDRQFLVVTLATANGKEIKVVGERWNPEEKCADPVKEAVATFSTALNARFKRVEIGKELVFKGGQALF